MGSERLRVFGFISTNLRNKATHAEKRRGSVRETNETDLSRINCISSSLTMIKEGDIIDIQTENEQSRPQICISDRVQIYISDHAHFTANMNEYHDLGDGSHASLIHPNLPEIKVLPSKPKDKTWGGLSYQSFCDKVNDIYNEIVHFGRNIFKIPSGRVGKNFIKELTCRLKQFHSR